LAGADVVSMLILFFRLVIVPQYIPVHICVLSRFTCDGRVVYTSNKIKVAYRLNIAIGHAFLCADNVVLFKLESDNDETGDTNFDKYLYINGL